MKFELSLLAISTAFSSAALAQSPGHFSEHPFALDGIEFLAEASTAKAQAEAARAQGEAWRQWGDELRASLGTMFGHQFAATKVVKGAPYSADIVTEANQSLADGNVISKKTSGRVYRDGEGRTRQETFVGGEPKSIQLSDPVEGKSFLLLPGSKKAIAMPRLAIAGESRELKVIKLGAKEIRIENGKVTVDGKETGGVVSLSEGGKEIRIENGKVTLDGKEVVAGAGSGSKVIVKRIDKDETGDGTLREEVRVHVVHAGDAGSKEIAITAPLPPMPPIVGGSLIPKSDAALARAKSATTSLGMKEFDGVKAEGKNTLYTIAAGEIGNRNAIMVTTESWYSPELQVTVYSRQSDPRYGETIYRLSNIRRGEPAADLFKVPEEYTKRGKG